MSVNNSHSNPSPSEDIDNPPTDATFVENQKLQAKQLQTKQQELVEPNLKKIHEEIDSLNKAAWELRDSDVLEARKQIEKAKTIIDHLAKQGKPYTEGLALYLKVSAFLIFRQREFEEALSTAFAALRLYTKLGKTKDLAKVFSIIAIIYIELGDFVQAYTYLLKQLSFAKEYGDLLVAASASHDIGLLYDVHTEDTALALHYFDEAQHEFEKLNQAWGACITKANKSAVYIKMGQYQKALKLANEALDYGITHAHDTAKCYGYCRLGSVYAALEQPTEAITNLNQALILSRQLSYDEISAKALLTKGQLSLAAQETEAARDFFNDAIKASKTVHDESILRDCYIGISDSYKIEGDFQMALVTYESYIATNIKEKHTENKRKLHNIELIKSMEAMRQDAEVTKTQNIALVEKLDELNKLQEELYQLSTRDALTNLHNRRYATEQLNIIFGRAKVQKLPLCIALLDLDHFKSINDSFSHLIGDTVLKTVAKILSDSMRDMDIAARYGGEEFLLVFPNTSLKGAITVCERIRKTIQAHDWEQHTAGLKVTTSIGVAQSSDERDFESLIATADKLLYESKEKGRNTLSSA